MIKYLLRRDKRGQDKIKPGGWLSLQWVQGQMFLHAWENRRYTWDQGQMDSWMRDVRKFRVLKCSCFYIVKKKDHLWITQDREVVKDTWGGQWKFIVATKANNRGADQRPMIELPWTVERASDTGNREFLTTLLDFVCDFISEALRSVSQETVHNNGIYFFTGVLF